MSLESLLNCLSTAGSELWVSDWETSENKSPSSHSGSSWQKKQELSELLRKKNTKEFMENQNQIIWAIQWNQINYNKYLYLTNSSLFQILSTSRMKQTFHCQLNRFFTYINLTRLGYDAVSLKKIILTYITYIEDKSLQYVWYTVNF